MWHLYNRRLSCFPNLSYLRGRTVIPYVSDIGKATLSAVIFTTNWKQVFSGVIIQHTARGEPAVSYRWTGWLILRNNRLKFVTSGDLSIILEESMEYTSSEWKQNRMMSTCNRSDLESLGSWTTVYGHKLPRHWSRTQCSSLKCAHAFQCEGFKIITLHSNFFLQHFTKKNQTSYWLFCIEYENNMISHYFEEVYAIKQCIKII